jgi:hypothetical protein
MEGHDLHTADSAAIRANERVGFSNHFTYWKET